jgi:hypothetical protein
MGVGGTGGQALIKKIKIKKMGNWQITFIEMKNRFTYLPISFTYLPVPFIPVYSIHSVFCVAWVHTDLMMTSRDHCHFILTFL